MSEPMVEFKMLEAKPVGNDVVVFHLEDGTNIKVRVSLDRVGVALNFKNPDGTPHYSTNFNLAVNILPGERKFTIPKSQIQVPTPPKPPDSRHVA